jgi:hypothetical protein
LVQRLQVLRDLSRPDLAPDFVFDCKDFYPLIPDSGGGADADIARRLLAAWRSAPPPAEARAVGALLASLVRLFFDHQRRRLAGLRSERLAFELGMLEDTGCTQLLLTGDGPPAHQLSH